MNYHIVASCFRASCIQTHMEEHLESIEYNLRNLNWTVTDCTDLSRCWVWWIKYRIMQFTGWVARHSHKPGDLALWKSAEHLIISLPLWLGCDGRAVHSSRSFQIILDIQSFNVSLCVDDYTAGLLKLNVLYICSYCIGCTIYGDLDTMRVWRQSSIRWAPISVAARDTEGGLDGNKLQCLINKCLMCKISYTELFMMMMMMMNMLNVLILRRDRGFKKPLSLSKSLGWENVSGDRTQPLNGLQHDNTSFVCLGRHSWTQMYHQASSASFQKNYEVH
jgi:hypothetical protein